MRPGSVLPPPGHLGVSYWEGQQLVACTFQPPGHPLPQTGDLYCVRGKPPYRVVTRSWDVREDGLKCVDVQLALASEYGRREQLLERLYEAVLALGTWSVPEWHPTWSSHRKVAELLQELEGVSE